MKRRVCILLSLIFAAYLALSCACCVRFHAETLNTEGLGITAGRAERRTVIGFSPGENKTVVRIRFNISNRTDKIKRINCYDFTCTANGILCRQLPAASCMVMPGKSTEIYIYCEIPKNAEEVEVRYKKTAWRIRPVI